MEETPEKPVRKFPAPCWTPEETAVLIEAYRVRWYALRRGYLRTPDWDGVAVEVHSRCPDVAPAKTSAQCRHKMEKLRQKYRNEKQRSLSFPGRYFSSWAFFDQMDTMENGPSSAPGSDQVAKEGVINSVLPADQVKTLNYQNSAALGLKSRKFKKIDRDSNPNLVFDHHGLDPGANYNRNGRNLINLGFRAKNGGPIEGNSNPNFSSRVLNGYSSYLDNNGSDQDEEDSDVGLGGGFKNPIDGNLVPPRFRGSTIEKIHGNLKPIFDSDHEAENGVNDGVDASVHQMSVPNGFRPKKFGKFDGVYNGMNANGGFCVKSPNNRNSVPPGFKSNSSAPNFDPRFVNGFPSPRPGFGKKSDGGGGAKRERERGVMEEVVSSIKLLGEGFVKMEKMKMEMAMEIEQMRMEMEMKRNEMVLDSQRQIVDAFLKVLMENKKQKVKTEPSLES